MRFRRSALRYGSSPHPDTPFLKAAQVWDQRIGTSRVQARNWRLMAFGCLGVAFLLLGTLAWLLRAGSAVPYVIEVDAKGAVRTVGPVEDQYRPSDAQIAYHLARFVEHVRSLSIDPVVVRTNWLKAYDFVTDKAALTLNEHAREADPFARIGQRSIAIEVTSVVRASDTSFQVRWIERWFEGGALQQTLSLTGIFTLLLSPPRTAETIRKNPLGIYVTAFNWTVDLPQKDTR